MFALAAASERSTTTRSVSLARLAMLGRDLLDAYLDDSERNRSTPSTYLRRAFPRDVGAYRRLLAELERAETAGRVVAVTSRGGSTAYIENIH
jgi:hypothetical protein